MFFREEQLLDPILCTEYHWFCSHWKPNSIEIEKNECEKQKRDNMTNGLQLIALEKM